jgi:hypothetical protein
VESNLFRSFICSHNLAETPDLRIEITVTEISRSDSGHASAVKITLSTGPIK